MHVLILGNATDAHAAHLKSALEQSGVKAYYWDTREFPTQVRSAWYPQSQTGFLLLPQGVKLAFDEIQSVFWRSFSGAYVPPLQDTEAHQIAIRDASSLLRSLLQACPARWVNSWQAYQFHKEKPLQLARAQQLGVPIPSTLISNDPEAVLQFCFTHDQVIFKPVYGGAHTQIVTPEHLQLQRLKAALSFAPVTLQAYIPGTNVRSYVIGDAIYTAEIRSPAIDFREDATAQLIPTPLPDPIQAQCLAIAKAFFLEWTAIDWRVQPTGEYVFLEANPSPMFLHFEQQTEFPITKALTRLLTQ